MILCDHYNLQYIRETKQCLKDRFKGPQSATPLFLFTLMREFRYYTLFRERRNKGNQCGTTTDDQTHFPEHNLQYSSKISLHRAMSIILMASKMAEADLGPLMNIAVL